MQRRKRCSTLAVATPLLHGCTLDDRVVAGAGEGMTAEDAGERHPSTAQGAEALDGLHGIFGAGRHEAAGWRKQGRDGPLVGSQQLQRDEFGEGAQEWLPAFGLRASAFSLVALSEFVFPDSFCSITAKARVTSFTTAAKSVVSNDFLGLMTTSAATPVVGRVMRTASRRRRFMRLRWTAPPRARPTVNPMRRPAFGVSDSGRGQ
jgi:hypothetical protein